MTSNAPRRRFSLGPALVVIAIALVATAGFDLFDGATQAVLAVVAAVLAVVGIVVTVRSWSVRRRPGA